MRWLRERAPRVLNQQAFLLVGNSNVDDMKVARDDPFVCRLRAVDGSRAHALPKFIGSTGRALDLLGCFLGLCFKSTEYGIHIKREDGVVELSGRSHRHLADRSEHAYNRLCPPENAQPARICAIFSVGVVEAVFVLVARHNHVQERDGRRRIDACEL